MARRFARPAKWQTSTDHLERLSRDTGARIEIDNAHNTAHLASELAPYWAELEPAGLPGVAA